jgi:hypothetical protein
MSWLEAIFEPSLLVRGAQTSKAPTPPMGLALLLDGRLHAYRLFAPRGGWPSLGEELGPRASPSQRLLSAVGRHLTGSGDPESDYLRLSRSRDTQLACVALLLLSFAYSDAGQPAASVRLLTSRLLGRYEPLEQGLLLLQLAVRRAEVSQFEDAIAATETCETVIRAARQAQWRDSLAALATYNRFAFEERVTGLLKWPADLPPVTIFGPLIRNEALLAEGLTDFLNTSFQRSLADPYSRTVSWRAEDPTETGLRGALIRAEILGHWQEIRQMRSLLGRYFVLSRLGTPGSVPPAALELLRRAGDADGIRSAARTMSRIGPAPAVRAATSALISRGDLGEDEPTASLRLIEIGADLLEAADAEKAARQLMADPEKFISQWNASPGALAALVASSPRAVQSQSARFVRSLLNQPNDALVQGLSQVVAAIRWEEVDRSERSTWLSVIEAEFGSGTDAHFVYAQAILQLAEPESHEIEFFLKRRFAQEVTLDLLALIFDTSPRVPSWARKPGWDLLSNALDRVRADAQAGTYGIGTIDVCDLATGMLLRDRRNEAGWSQLVDFLLDPTVSISSKERAFDRLARARPAPPALARKRLQEAFATLEGATVDLASTPEGFTGAKLRLASRLDGLSRDQMLTELISLSSSGSAYGRIEAAATIPYVRRRLSAPVVTAVALMLSRDPDPDVRGRAAHSLAQLLGIAEDAIDLSVRNQLADLLASEGTVVPYSAVQGLHEFALSGGRIDDRLLDLVERLASHHMSQRIRHAARELTAAIQERDSRKKRGKR